MAALLPLHLKMLERKPKKRKSIDLSFRRFQ
jgi:hypothetical protein